MLAMHQDAPASLERAGDPVDAGPDHWSRQRASVDGRQPKEANPRARELISIVLALGAQIDDVRDGMIPRQSFRGARRDSAGAAQRQSTVEPIEVERLSR
jgi:hypothetical protein